jgi:hypothetical protein
MGASIHDISGHSKDLQQCPNGKAYINFNIDRFLRLECEYLHDLELYKLEAKDLAKI